MKLTQKQIDYLFDFVRRHYVEWYDLQVEMVDHLANDIEKIMEEQPEISFEEALDKAFKKFGAMGFMDVAEQKMNALRKSFLKNIFHEFKKFLFSPRILLLIFSIYILYRALIFSPYKLYLIILTYLIITIIPLYNFIKYFLYLRRKKKNNEPIYLVEQSILYSSLFIYSLIVLQLSLQSFSKIYQRIENGQINDKTFLIFSLISMLLIWSYYFVFVKVPQKMIANTRQQYENLRVAP